jgi:hypothetical protein
VHRLPGLDLDAGVITPAKEVVVDGWELLSAPCGQPGAARIGIDRQAWLVL